MTAPAYLLAVLAVLAVLLASGLLLRPRLRRPSPQPLPHQREQRDRAAPAPAEPGRARLDAPEPPGHAEQLSAIVDTCSLREVIETAAACARLPAERLRIELPEGAAFVATSPSALGRILTNLLQNAVRYGPRDGGILVRARRCTRTGTTEVAVLDEGSGPGNEAALPPPEAQGLGSRVVDELTASLGGTLVRQWTALGYAVAVSIPDR